MEKSFTIIVSILLFLFVFGYVLLATNSTQAEKNTFSSLQEFKNSQEIQQCSFATDGCNMYRIIDGKIGPSTQHTCKQSSHFYCVEYTHEFIG